MTVELIKKSARYAVIAIKDGGDFYTKKEYDILLDGKVYRKVKKCVNCIWGLKPETDYVVSVEGESLSFHTDYEFVTLDVTKFGAHGDGVSDDTVFIQAAIAACPKESRVLVPAGNYKLSNIFLKSGVRLELSHGARIIADNERYAHPIFPGMTQAYDEKSEYNLGTWEGNPLPMFAGIITVLDVENVEIYGEGEIDGNASHSDWWYDEKKMRGAFRPRTIFLSRTKNVVVVGIKLKNSPSWTIHPYFSENLELLAVKINNPMNSPNTDGVDIESCRDVRVTGSEFTLGDDCIAIKSGKIYMSRYNAVTENITISHCLMENGHGAVTLGSEMSSGIKDVLVENCEFIRTDRGLRIKTRRGRGNKAIIDNVIFRNIFMDEVLTPFVINSFYFCDPDGKTEYVQTREKLPVDERTPLIKKLLFSDIFCHNTHYAAGYFCGLPEQKIEGIALRNITVDYSKNAEKGTPAMHCNAVEMSRHGFFAENVSTLSSENVKIYEQNGEKFELRGVDNFIEGETK